MHFMKETLKSDSGHVLDIEERIHAFGIALLLAMAIGRQRAH